MWSENFPLNPVPKKKNWSSKVKSPCLLLRVGNTGSQNLSFILLFYETTCPFYTNLLFHLVTWLTHTSPKTQIDKFPETDVFRRNRNTVDYTMGDNVTKKHVNKQSPRTKCWVTREKCCRLPFFGVTHSLPHVRYLTPLPSRWLRYTNTVRRTEKIRTVYWRIRYMSQIG